MVLAQHPEFAGSLLLLDELAARSIATSLDLSISGFASVLLLAGMKLSSQPTIWILVSDSWRSNSNF